MQLEHYGKWTIVVLAFKESYWVYGHAKPEPNQCKGYAYFENGEPLVIYHEYLGEFDEIKDYSLKTNPRDILDIFKWEMSRQMDGVDYAIRVIVSNARYMKYDRSKVQKVREGT